MNNQKKVDETTISHVANCIENEGFEYCFDNYSDFKTVKDTNFHKLLNSYIIAKKNLEKYIEHQSRYESDLLKHMQINQK